MAVLTGFQGIGQDNWGPEYFEGGTVGTRNATTLRYVSDVGVTVEFIGTGFRYDAEGFGVRGTVNRIVVRDGDGARILEITDFAAELATLMQFAFGFERDDRDPRDPDGNGLVRHVLRGNDTLLGSNENDDLFGSGSGDIGNDSINGRGGDDYIKGDAGNDTLYGGDGRDWLSYDETYWDPYAYRGIVLDVVAGTVTDSWGGTDVIGQFERYRDSAFDDVMRGSDIEEESWQLSRGADTLDGRGGFDWLDYNNAGRFGGRGGIAVDLAAGTVRDPWGSIDRVAGIEGVGGTRRNDSFLGDAEDNVFQGLAGRDSFNGRGGEDQVAFWDNIWRGGGAVTIDMSRTSGQIRNDGWGNVENVTSIERFNLSDFGDSYSGSSGEDNVNGRQGNDTLRGGGGEDWLNGDEGNDDLYGGAGENHLSGGEGIDRLYGGSDDDDFNFRDLGAANRDTIFGFSRAQGDEIWIDSDWGGLSQEFLTAAQFRSGAGVTTASTSAHRVIYNTSNGTLYFDRDGAGGAAAEVFAVLDNRAALNFGDFSVFL